MKKQTVYDEVCGWPYHTPYGYVTAPKIKKPRKPRKPRLKFKMDIDNGQAKTQTRDTRGNRPAPQPHGRAIADHVTSNPEG